MNLKNLFFHIHYCNSRKLAGSERYSKKITRTIPHHELILITGGKGCITLDKKRYPVKGTMLFYICPHILHSLEIEMEELGCFLSVHFSYADVSLHDGRWDLREAIAALPLHPAEELKDAYQVDEVFKRLVESWDAKLPGYEFITRTLLQQLLITIYQNLSKENHNYGASRKVENIIQYMHQNVGCSVTLAELAKLVQLSPAYLTRAFKEITGYTIIEYFNKIKMDKAKEMMMEGDRKIKEVAQALGFTDEFYFSRIFKKIEGVSPSEYYSKIVHGV